MRKELKRLSLTAVSAATASIYGAFRLHQLLFVVALSTGPGLEAELIHFVLKVAFVDRGRQFSFASLRLSAVVLLSFFGKCV